VAFHWNVAIQQGKDLGECVQTSSLDDSNSTIDIPNLHVIQTLTSAKTASALDKHLSTNRTSPLNVMIQVNTSGETSKSGLAPIDVEMEEGSEAPSLEILDLANHVISSCKNLHLLGVMTIGSFEASTSHNQLNPDFVTLMQTRDKLESKLKESHGAGTWGHDGKLLTSMGMSSDFEEAIQAGSDIVRVGTSIFGHRPPKGM
jgi:pyridoxal phosphate enzyme (YggS family)